MYQTRHSFLSSSSLSLFLCFGLWACSLSSSSIEVTQEHTLQQNCMKGDAAACSNLAVLYEKGLLAVEKDVTKASTLYRQACEGGVESACLTAQTLHP